jgi:phosphatidylglycerol:prolipoprotein diacylglycerol transferase
MHPILFEFGGVPVYTYGLLHLLAVCVLGWIGARWARRKGAEGASGVDAAVAYPVAMFLLARIPYVILEHGFTPDALGAFPQFTDGGYWGGLAVMLLLISFYALARGFPFWTVFDLVAPPLALALAVGKLGCFLGGCCWGGPSGEYFGLMLHPDRWHVYPEGPLHPVPLYDALWAAVVGAGLMVFHRVARRPGTVFLLFVLFYAAGRFSTEFLRHHYTARTNFNGLYTSQIVELASAAAAVLCLFWIHVVKRRRWPAEDPGPRMHDHDLPVCAVAARRIPRTFAFLADALPVSALFLAALAAGGGPRVALLLSAGALYLLFHVLLPRTPGMALFRLETMDHKGHPTSLWRRFLRALALPVGALSVVGWFRPLVSSSGQTFHDMVAGVHVVEKER